MEAFKTTLITSVGAFLIGAASAAFVCIPVFAHTDGGFAPSKSQLTARDHPRFPIWANPRTTLSLPHSMALLWLRRQRT